MMAMVVVVAVTEITTMLPVHACDVVCRYCIGAWLVDVHATHSISQELEMKIYLQLHMSVSVCI